MQLSLIIYFIFLSALMFSAEPFLIHKSGKNIKAKRINEKVIVDGILDESFWSEIDSKNDFIQESPDYFSNPTEKTDVKIAYDRNTLYVAAILYDSNPLLIKEKLALRDDWVQGFENSADWFSIEIDSEHTHQTAYSFSVNASGVQCDDMIYDDMFYDNSYNAIWDSQVVISNDGWIVEIAIPFSMLKFGKSGQYKWGINFTRYIYRKDEEIKWLVLPVESKGIVSTFGHLLGIEDIYPPTKFEVLPYMSFASDKTDDYMVLLNFDNNNEGAFMSTFNSNIAPAFQKGIDLKYRFNNNTDIDFSYNPYFGQIEADPTDINLTAYETYYDEKRPFFNEIKNLFYTPFELFYSRRVGDDDYLFFVDSNSEQGDAQLAVIPLKINHALKLTGKMNSNLDIGLISVKTKFQDISGFNPYNFNTELLKNNGYKSGSEQYNIFRLRQNFLNGNSYLGVLATNKETNINSDFQYYQSFMPQFSSNRFIALDGLLNLINNNLFFKFQVISDFNDGSASHFSFGYHLSPELYFLYQREYLDTLINYNNIGFMPRNNLIDDFIKIVYNKKNNKNFIREFSHQISFKNQKNHDNILLNKFFKLGTNLLFNNFSSLELSFKNSFASYDDRKIYRDLDIYGSPVYLPDLKEYNIQFESNTKKQLSILIDYRHAVNKIEDNSNTIRYDLKYNPNTSLNFVLRYERYKLNKKYHFLESIPDDNCDNCPTNWYQDNYYIDNHFHDMFASINNQIEIYSINANYNFTSKLSFRMYVEYYRDNDTLFNYSELKAGSKLPESNTNFITGSEGGGAIYSNDFGEFGSAYSRSYLDPNLSTNLYPKYSALNINIVLKWLFSKGSNLYLVYTFTRDVNGKSFNSLIDFIKYDVNLESLFEIQNFNNQGLYLKLDYWFNI